MIDIKLEKNCKNCGILKAFNCFTINKKLKDGRCNYCKECEKEKREQNKNKVSEQRKNRREKWKENPVEYTEKTCKVCGVSKSLEKYSDNKIRKDGKESSCKECMMKKNGRNSSKVVEQQNFGNIPQVVQGQKICSTCGVSKSLGEYYTIKRRNKDCKKINCKDCIKKNQEQHRVKHTEKICNTCVVSKSLDEYTNNRRYKDGKENQCKECVKRKQEQNKEKLIEYRIEFQKKWREKNPEYMKQYSKTDKRKSYLKTYANSCDHKRYKQSCGICKPIDHLSRLCRNRIRNALKGNKKLHTQEYLGCNYDTLRAHIEKQFKEGMTWENHGEWHIDHIVPIQYGNPDFEKDYNIIVERLHYTNLQPLWAQVNYSKNNRYIG
jgi:hypothetical protein